MVGIAIDIDIFCVRSRTEFNYSIHRTVGACMIKYGAGQLIHKRKGLRL